MDPYRLMRNTDEEVDGVWAEILSVPTWKLKLARAGGRNTKYEALLTKAMKPNARRLNNTALPMSEMRELQIPIYAAILVKDWQTQVDGEWVTGIQPFEMTPAGPQASATAELWPVTKENVEKVFRALPDYFQEVVAFCERAESFKSDMLEIIAGN